MCGVVRRGLLLLLLTFTLLMLLRLSLWMHGSSCSRGSCSLISSSSPDDFLLFPLLPCPPSWDAAATDRRSRADEMLLGTPSLLPALVLVFREKGEREDRQEGRKYGRRGRGRGKDDEGRREREERISRRGPRLSSSADVQLERRAERRLAGSSCQVLRLGMLLLLE